MRHSVHQVDREKEILVHLLKLLGVEVVLNQCILGHFIQFSLAFQLHFSVQQILLDPLQLLLFRTFQQDNFVRNDSELLERQGLNLGPRETFDNPMSALLLKRSYLLLHDFDDNVVGNCPRKDS